MRRPIKHIIDTTLVDVNGSAYTANAIALVKGVSPSPDPYAIPQNQVNAGSAIVTHIKLWIQYWINTKTTVSATKITEFIDSYIWFNIASGQSRPNPASAGTSDLKNQIFWTNSLVIGSSTAVNTALDSRRIIDLEVDVKIPKWAQKINKDDQIELVMATDQTEANFNMKLKGIFMEYEQS